VARAASSLCGNVTSWFARGNCTVVTGGATTWRHTDVIEFGSGKCIRVMAGITRQLCGKVVYRFGQIPFGQPVATHVTTCTISWRPLEDAIHVAGLASHTTVLAHQCKACTHMVKLVIRGLCIGMGQPCTKDDDEKQNCCHESRGQRGKALCHDESPV
jgi:hypothetical protein